MVVLSHSNTDYFFAGDVGEPAGRTIGLPEKKKLPSLSGEHTPKPVLG
jgi:hypothetical protein